MKHVISAEMHCWVKLNQKSSFHKLSDTRNKTEYAIWPVCGQTLSIFFLFPIKGNTAGTPYNDIFDNSVLPVL